MDEWVELAEGVLQRRYQPLDVSVCVVVGRDGVLVVDTRCNPREGEELAADIAALRLGPVRWVVDTHAHYDHTFGNQVFSGTAEIHGHRAIAEHFAAFEAPRLAAWTADPAAQPQYDWTDVRLTPPDHPVDGETVIDLGGRTVRIVAIPPGHTDTDVAVHVADAGVWIVGDVIEQSGPPMYGSGSYPFGWPDALVHLAGMIGEHEVVVPGHGEAVDRAFVLAQARTLGIVAEAIRDGHAHGEPMEYLAERAASASRLPLEIVESAVVRGLAQLGPA